jgi:NAD(P)-dependent dehydrogenase (short-subunit alcohol dehydrogenase family)
MNDFNQQAVLLTGASSGIGEACAIRLARSGAKLILTGRCVDSLEQTASKIGDAVVEIAPCDLQNVNGIDSWFKSLRERVGYIDHFVHCAGVQVSKPIKSFSLQHFDQIMHTNLASAMAISKGLRFKRDKSKQGAIVFVSSIAGFIGQPANVAYGASKAGLMSLTRGLAVEFLRDNIRVNCVAPALVDTPMTRKTQQEMTSEQYQKLIDRHPMGVGKPSDVASAVSFLLSEESRWINGVTLPVDGGHSIA